jgi:hypothetical protein
VRGNTHNRLPADRLDNCKLTAEGIKKRAPKRPF